MENKEDSCSELVENYHENKILPLSELEVDIPKKSNSENQTPAKWVDNYGKEVESVFGFNGNAELVNGRVAMVGFLLLILTELVFSGTPITKSIFGIG